MYDILDMMSYYEYIKTKKLDPKEPGMTYQDRNNVVSILVNLLVNGYITLRILDMNAGGAFAGPDAVNVWARTVVWVIPISIAATIVGTILFAILHAIATGNPRPSFVVDERDRMFERRSMVATLILAAFGFIAAIVMLAFGWSALVGFNVIYYAMALGSLAGDLVRFISYRRGY